MNVESITYEHEEDGLWMILQLDVEIPLVTDEGRLRVRVQDVSEELYDKTKAAIGPWLRERDEARFAHVPGFKDAVDEMQEAYDISDPKHPDYHSVHADIWDAREGK